nr:hypothetical protein [Acidobacteriota bacterium]
MNKNLSSILLVLSLLPVAACHKEESPVGRLEVQPPAIRLPHGQLAVVRFNWSPTAPLEGGPDKPMVFVHLLDAKGTVARTFDHQLPQPWKEGTPVSYEVRLYQSALAPPLAPGKYRLSVGLYDRGGKRWPLDGLGKPIARDEYAAADVEVAANPEGPSFGYSPTWLPVEPGGDRQLLARRWLVDRGALRLQEVHGPGVVWMLLKIPAGDGPSEKLVLDAGASAPAVKVTGTCGKVETEISGPGNHEVEMPIDGPSAEGVCRVLLVPNFHLTSAAFPEQRTVSLDNLAWIPGAGARPNPA